MTKLYVKKSKQHFRGQIEPQMKLVDYQLVLKSNFDKAKMPIIHRKIYPNLVKIELRYEHKKKWGYLPELNKEI
jgi:hypothetical protein